MDLIDYYKNRKELPDSHSETLNLVNRLYARIEKLKDGRKEVFDLAHTMALANIDDRLVDPISRIAELSKPLEE